MVKGNKNTSVVSSSAAIAVGTMASRVTGALRIIVATAVFGPALIGDVFLAINMLPLTLLSIFGGPAVTSVLVPPLVRHLENNPQRANRLASKTLGIFMAMLVVAVAIFVLFRGLLAALLASGFEAASTEKAVHFAELLLLVMLPQLICYGMISVLVAAQHAYQKFLVASFAPSVENLTMIAVLLVVSLHLNTLTEPDQLSDRWVYILGFGSTLAVFVHLALQYIGAFTAGARVRPVLAKPDDDLKEISDGARGSAVWSMVSAVLRFGLVVAAGYGAVAGSVQAFEIATLLQILPGAVVGYPLAAAVLPRLATHSSSLHQIGVGYRHTARLAMWALAPAGLAMCFFSEPIARALSFGRFDDEATIALASAAILGLGISASLQGSYEVARQATMALGDLRAFRLSTWVGFFTAAILIFASVSVLHGAQLLMALGLSMGISGIIALVIIDQPLRNQQLHHQQASNRLGDTSIKHGVVLSPDLVAMSNVFGKGDFLRVLATSVVAVLVTKGVEFALAAVTTQAQLVVVVLAVTFLFSYLCIGYLLTENGRQIKDSIAKINSLGSVEGADGFV